MGLMSALAMMGAGAEGFVKGKREEEEAQRQREADAYQKTQRTFTLGEQQNLMQRRAEMAAASNAPPEAASSSPTQASMPDGEVALTPLRPEGPMQRMVAADSPDDYGPGDAPGDASRAPGQPSQPAAAPVAPVAPAGTMLNAVARQGQPAPVAAPGELGQMQAAAQGRAAPAPKAGPAVDPNSPEAVMERQAAVLQKYDPVAAASLRSTSMKLTVERNNLANLRYESDVKDATARAMKTGNPEPLINFGNDSEVDLQGGSVKARVVYSPDKKTFSVLRVFPDGTTEPTALTDKPNNAQSIAEIAYGLSKAPSAEARMAHYLAVTKEGREGLVSDADVKLKTAEAGWYNDRTDVERAKINAKGAGKMADHFTEKEWDAAHKIEPSFVSFGDPMFGKPIESPELRLIYARELQKERGAGNMSPSEAAEAARTTTLKLKNAASDKVAAALKADPKSTLTEPQAMRTVLKDYDQEQIAQRRRQQSLQGGQATADPLGLRGGQAQPGAAIAPSVQQGRDIEAGKLMVANEYGGDVGRAQAAVAEMQSAIDKAPSTGAANDAKAMLREQMGRLVAGIEATKNGAAQPSKAPATQAAAAKPARPMQDATQGASTSGPDASPEGATLDTARAATKAASTKLMAYGSSQRARNPMGFAAAQRAYDDAKAAEDSAMAAYTTSVSRTMPTGLMVQAARP